jgi:Cys-rich repeat protein
VDPPFCYFTRCVECRRNRDCPQGGTCINFTCR